MINANPNIKNWLIGTCNSNQKWNNDKCQCNGKTHLTPKKDYSWNAGSCIYKNSRYLKFFVDDSIILCDETMNVTDTVSITLANTKSTNVISAVPNAANTKPANVMSALSTNVSSIVTIYSDDEKGIYKINCCILHRFSWSKV